MNKLSTALSLCLIVLPAFPAPAEDKKTGKASPERTTDKVEFIIGPDYADAPELTVKPGTPQGTVHEFVIKSGDSKIYPGIAKKQPGTAPYERKVAVYIPKQYRSGQEAPFLIAQDGMGYRGFLPTILDNLIAKRRVPPLIGMVINSGGGDSKGSQRGLEYDTVSGTYADQQSPENPGSPDGAWEYHKKLIPNTVRKPLRIWLHVSENDNGSKPDEASHHNWVMANQRMAAALKAKSYPYRYVFAEAAGHTDGRVTRQTLPAALEWLWQGFKAR